MLYNIFIFTVLLLGMGFLAPGSRSSSLGRIVLDFGMTAINLAGAMLATFGGSLLLPREFERRTLYVALSKPLSRPEFRFWCSWGLPQ